MIPTRELAANSGKVMETLAAEGYLVITKDGQPRSILLPTSAETLLEDVRDCLYARAAQGLKRAQLGSTAKGKQHMTSSDIDEEIRAVRRKRPE